MDVKGRAVPLSWYEEISHAGSAGDAALDWGGRALCAESERVSALMSASAPRLLSLCEFRLPVKGLAGRHRLSRVPACMSISTEPQAPRMLDGPSARSDHQDVSLSSVKLQSETRVLRSAHVRPSGLAASGFYAQKKACQNESKKTAGVLAPETKTQHDQRRLGCSGRVLLLCLLKRRGLITGLVYPHAINVGWEADEVPCRSFSDFLPPNWTCGWIGHQRGVDFNPFPMALRRTRRDSFDITSLSSGTTMLFP